MGRDLFGCRLSPLDLWRIPMSCSACSGQEAPPHRICSFTCLPCRFVLPAVRFGGACLIRTRGVSSYGISRCPPLSGYKVVLPLWRVTSSDRCRRVSSPVVLVLARASAGWSPTRSRLWLGLGTFLLCFLLVLLQSRLFPLALVQFPSR